MASALFIGARSPLSSGALAGWLASGNRVAEFWSETPDIGRRPFGTPPLGPERLIARHGIKAQTVPWLSKDPGLMGAVAATGADVLITCATEMIVPGPMLAHFGTRAVNLHPALLPEYRGPSPYVPMLLDGSADACGGVTLHLLSAGIDEGDIVAQERVGFTEAGTDFYDWYEQLIGAAYRLSRDELPRFLKGEVVARPQSGGSYRKVPVPFRLGAELPAKAVRQALERAGSTMQVAISVPTRRRAMRVSHVLRAGPTSGKPPRIGPLTVELDFADARLKLRRATGVDRQLAQWRLARALRPLQL